MSRAAWTALIAAIAFPSVALSVVLLHGARPPVGPPLPSSPGDPFGPPPPHTKAPPPLADGLLVGMREELDLTDEQVERIWKIGEPARRRVVELRARIDSKERELFDMLSAEAVEEGVVEMRLEELHALRLDHDKLMVLTPLRLRQALTPEQQAALLELWRDRRAKGPPLGPGKGPLHGLGKGPPHGPGKVPHSALRPR